MPTSLMATMSLNATQFNANAAKVIDKSKQIGAQVAEATKKASGTITGVNMSRSAGLMSDPAAFIGAEEREKEMARRRAQTMAAHEAWLAKKNAATRAAAEQEKAIFGGLDKRNAKLQAEIQLYKEMGKVHPSQYTGAYAAALDKHSAGADKAARSTSALGGAAKMFAGYMTLDFIGRKTGEMIKHGGKVSDISDRYGISTTAVQQWDYALKQNGSSIEDAGRFFDRLATNRDKALGGNQRMIDAFAKLGVSVADLKSKRLEDIGVQIGKAFETGDPQELLADLRTIGGRSASELVTAFSAGLTGLFADAPVTAENVISELDRIGDKWDELGQQAATAFAPFIAAISEGIFGAIELFRTAAAGVLGFAEGTVTAIFEGIQDKSPAKILAALTGDAGAARAGEFVDDYKEGIALEKKAKEEAALRKSSRLRSGGPGDDEDQADGVTALSSAKEKLLGLETRRAEIQKQLSAAKTDDERNKAGASLSQINREVEDAKKALSTKERNEANRIQRLREGLAKKEADAALIGLKPEEKKEELLRRRAALVEEIEAASGEEDQLKLKKELADIDKAIAKDGETVEKRKQRLREGLAKKDDAAALVPLDKEEKLAALKLRRAEMEKRAQEAARRGDELGELEAKTDLADVNRQILPLEKESDEERNRLLRPKGNSLQQIGGFLGNFRTAAGPEVVAQNTRQKMATHMENIEKLLKQRGKTWDSSSREVEY